MIFIVLYLLATAWMLVQAWRFKKSDKSISPVMMVYVLAFFLMGEQALFAFLFHLVHIPIGLLSVGITNALVGAVIFFFKRKYGVQKYDRFSITDVVSIAFLSVLTVGICVYMWGTSLEMSFLSIDGKDVHCMLSRFIAENGNYENPQFFEALNSALFMQMFRVFIPADEGYYRAHMFSQVVLFWMSAFGFYALCKTYTENRKHDYLAAILNFFYIVGYPLSVIYFGFAYFGQIINMIAGVLLVYRMMREEQVKNWFSIGMLNLMLFSMFACYSFFVPFVFPPLFVAIWMDDAKKGNKFFNLKTIRKEFQIFLLPCVFGLLNSYTNLSQLGSDGGINNNGGCYIDLYSNLLRLLPLVIVGICIVWKRNKFDILFLELVWSFLLLCVTFYFNHHTKISLYYISKIYNLIWLLFFLYIFVSLCEFRDRIPSVLVGIVVLLTFSFVIAHSKLPMIIVYDNPEIYAPIHADYHALYPDIYWYNQSMVESVHDMTH